MQNAQSVCSRIQYIHQRPPEAVTLLFAFSINSRPRPRSEGGSFFTPSRARPVGVGVGVGVGVHRDDDGPVRLPGDRDAEQLAVRLRISFTIVVRWCVGVLVCFAFCLLVDKIRQVQVLRAQGKHLGAEQ